MSSFEQRNAHFDRLFATRNLFWLGQNTNHLPMHPAVRKALFDCIEAEEFHAYAPPGCPRQRDKRFNPPEFG